LFYTESLVDKGTELGYWVQRDTSAVKTRNYKTLDSEDFLSGGSIFFAAQVEFAWSASPLKLKCNLNVSEAYNCLVRIPVQS